jgi:PKD repeat protein
MKKLSLLFLLCTITIFIACEKESAVADLAPVTPTTPQDDVTGEDDATTLSLDQFDGINLTDVPESKAVASFYIENQSGTVEEASQLVISNTSTNAVTYEWDFGNGDVLEGANPTYAFPYHGYYNVTLKVTDEDGMVSTATQGLAVICIYGGGDHEF